MFTLAPLEKIPDSATGKVLDTWPHSTYGLASIHCVLWGTFNIVILDSHTHISIHLAINMEFSSQNPNIHLSCNSSYLKP